MRKRIRGTLGAYNPYSRSVRIVAATPNPVEGEALTSWDLSRYMKNPLVCWAHDSVFSIPVGRCRANPGAPVEVEFDPVIGLQANVYFASEAANPFAEQLAKNVEEGNVIAVSVGYDEPEVSETSNADGTVTRTRTAAKLVEISFVPVGLDEDAGTPDINPDAESEVVSDEELSRRAKVAASELAKHRARMQRRKLAGMLEEPKPGAAGSAEKKKAKRAGDEVKCPECGAMNDGDAGKCEECGERLDERNDANDEDAFVNRLDVGRLDGQRVERTQVGGVRVRANLSRVGVLEYKNFDGTVRRELRLPEEVFKADSLRTLEDAPVIDIKHHTGMVDTAKWKEVNLGHVRDVKQEGRFVASSLVVNDQETLDAIDRGERVEISCGYRCKLDMTPGVYEGQPYDCVQRGIVYNHAALCPPNRGRAGPEVGLRLDGKTPAWAITHLDEGDIMKVRFNGKTYEAGSQEHVDAVEAFAEERAKAEATFKTKLDAAETNLAEVTKAKDKAEGERDAAKEALDKFNADAKKAKDEAASAAEKEKAQRSFKQKARRKLERMALRFFSDDDEEDDDDDEDKYDKLDAMSDREIMLFCIEGNAKAGGARFDSKDYEARNDDYVQARFDAMCEQALPEMRRKRGVLGVVHAAEDAKDQIARSNPREGRLDSNDGRGTGNALIDAQIKRDRAAADAWKNPPKIS